VEDCALVFAAIHGADGVDDTAVTRPFSWSPSIDIKKLRIGCVKSAFDEEREHKAADEATLAILRDMGAELVPIDLPDYPVEALNLILHAEAAAAFDELTRHDQDDLLVRQTQDAWPNVFRQARLITAVEYIQANRIRCLIMQEMAELMKTIDLYVAPWRVGDNLLLTNLTGHPAVVVPSGFSAAGIPDNSLSFMGNLYDEATILAAAKAYQDATGFHEKRPLLNP
jgi:Asp-tRNA(Asn)/Glu-tRNA(Gln) amidotransferase A subunit family amidase